MPITPLFVGDTHRPISVTWLDDLMAPVNLTGATLTVRFGGVATSATFTGTGTFSVLSAVAGTFTYTLSSADVAAPGTWRLQFVATFGDGSKVLADPIDLEVLAAI